MAGKKIFIEYDIDASDLKLANGETLSLTQQLRLLKKELQRGDLKPEQFDILRKKIGDTEDQIAKTTVKSKDFFGVLSSLPGPVGQFGGSLLGVVDTLKVFSSFTFKDIKNSLGDVADDVKEITENFTGLNKSTKEQAESNQQLTNSSSQTTKSLGEQATAAGTTAAAIQNQKKETQLLTVETDKNGQMTIKAVKPIKDMTQAEVQLFKEQRNRVVHTGKLTEATNAEAAASKNATNATNTQTGATKALTLAQRAATFATNALKLALASLGIGLVIIAVTKLIELIGEWITGTKAADAENERLTKSFANLKKSIDDTQEALKIQTDLLVLQAKIAGKTEEELFRIAKEGLDKRVKANEEGRKKIENQLLLLSINSKLTEEQKLKQQEELQKQYNELGERGFDLRIEGEKLVLNEELRLADKKRADLKTKNEKLLAQQKEYNQKVANDTKTANEQLITLQRENDVLALKTERERQDQELKNQRLAEEEKIKALEISKDLRDKLLVQIELKYNAKIVDINKKRKEEDLKSEKEFFRKREDIAIAAIEDTKKREDAERQIKLQRDLEDLEEDKEFIKLSEEAKEEIRKNIRQKYANEDKDILKTRNKEIQDDRLKALDDELRFLQIRQEAIRANTKAFFQGQRDILDVAEKREIELAEGKEKELTAIKEKYAKLRKDIDQQEKLATVMAVGETITAIGNLTSAIAAGYNEEAKTSKEAFEKRKKLQVATAKISAAGGIIQILAQPSTLPSPFDWIVKGINAAALILATSAQIKTIENTKFEGGGEKQAGTVRGMANGGIVRGPGGPKSDSVPTNLSNGEAVLTSGAVTMFAPLLSMMNQMGGGTSFSSDLSVASSDNPIRNNPAQEQTPVIMKTYVVERELTTSQEKQARLKDLSTL
jgi:hypothetical protein